MQGTGLRSLEEAEARCLETLRKALPDLADKVHHTKKRESRPPKKEWRPKPARADAVKPVSMRADDSFAKGVRRLLHLGLYGDAWVGQEHC
jgi:hypothetical protein